MKTAILKFVPAVCALLVFTTATTVSSCKKDKTCHGKVHVVDISGAPVASASVLLDAPGGQTHYNGTTDGSGDATFEVTLPAIFDVTATRDTMTGTGVIRLDEPGKEDDVTITVD